MQDYQEFENILKSSQEEQIRKRIVIIEYLSIVLTLVCILSSVYLAYFDNSMTALAVSIDSLLDILVHLVVLWRYCRPLYMSSKKIDTYANLSLAILFLVSSICIEFESIKNLLTHTKPIPSLLFIAISAGQSIIFSLLSIYKFYLAQHFTESSILISSGIDSFVTGISNFSMALSMGLFVMNKKIWFLDSSFGIIIGLIIFIYGLFLLFSVAKKN